MVARGDGEVIGDVIELEVSSAAASAANSMHKDIAPRVRVRLPPLRTRRLHVACLLRAEFESPRPAASTANSMQKALYAV